MINNNNQEIKKEMLDIFRLFRFGPEDMPSKISEQIIPVVDVNPKHSRIVNVIKGGQSNSTGTITILTVPAGKAFYLTGFTIQVDKDAACDNTDVALSTTLDGATVYLAYTRVATLTASSKVISRDLSCPVKVDAGNSISLTGAFTAGVLTRGYSILGYYIDI